jgi:hypothetical protein
LGEKGGGNNKKPPGTRSASIAENESLVTELDAVFQSDFVKTIPNKTDLYKLGSENEEYHYHQAEPSRVIRAAATFWTGRRSSRISNAQY